MQDHSNGLILFWTAIFNVFLEQNEWIIVRVAYHLAIQEKTNCKNSILLHKHYIDTINEYQENLSHRQVDIPTFFKINCLDMSLNLKVASHNKLFMTIGA